MELKMEAARRRKSIAAIVRETISRRIRVGEKENTDKLIMRMRKFAKKMSQKYPNLRLSEKVIEMRYEQ